MDILSKKSVKIPEWKKDLLKKLHAKAEAVKQKLASEAKGEGEKAVVDEHILKVSENVFVRQEYKRKMSTGKAISDHGLHVIRTDDIVIIENDAADEVFTDTKKNSEVKDVELPSAGIVSRLKDKFRNDKKIETASKPTTFPAIYKRAKSANDMFSPVFMNGVQEDGSALTPSNPSLPRTFTYPSDTSVTLNKIERKESVDLTTPRGFRSRKDSIENFVTPYHKVTSPTGIRKVTPPVLSPRKLRGPVKSASIDTSSLHAPGRKEFNTFDTVITEKAILPKLHSFEPSQDFNKEVITLHSGNLENQVKVEQNNNPYIVKTSEVIKSATLISPELHSVKSPHIRGPRSPANSNNVPPASNKENIPQVPKRRQINYTKAHIPASTIKSLPHEKSPMVTHQKSQDIIQSKDECRIIDLGRTSMDPSLLKSKAAIAANEIMKESKTIMIVPKLKSKATPVTQTPALSKQKQKVTAKDVKVVKNISNIDDFATNIPLPPPKDTVISSVDHASNKSGTKSINKTSTVPASSIDDVIAKDKEEKKVKDSVPNSGIKTVVIQENMPLSEDLSTKVPSLPKTAVQSKTVDIGVNSAVAETDGKAKSRSLFVKSSKATVQTNRDSSSGDTIQSLFGPKFKKPGTVTTNSFGGKSFVIDPSKFKSSARSATTTPTSASKGTVQSVGNTMVITPKTRAGSAPSPSDDNAQSKGKRKLTVDQIKVIGGYVKLDHSNLAKPNKIPKNNHVRFQDGRLETVFQYPSERSLLNEVNELSLNQKMASLHNKPSSMKDAKTSYTPKYLLGKKGNLDIEDNDEDDLSTISAPAPIEEKISSTDAKPLADGDATSFSFSSSNDLLF
ncbi:unnamed protein product [Clavelina lepadiformis]|uniref:Uncharacterized protein n=1 Tax=Clavelina lepadiformis TaxID=159417 RepID=A0ABP0F2L7_CLALP